VSLIAIGSLGATAVLADEAKRTWRDPVDRAAETMPLAAHALLLGMTESGTTTIAVGERGIVLLSTDREHWNQIADVPTQATLTAVTAVGERVWAVGHDGVIIASSDAGRHWSLQRKDPWQPLPADASGPGDPRQGAPLLSVLFLDETNGFAVGAYSQLLVTHDGGATWTHQDVVVHPSGQTAAAAKPQGDGDDWTFTRSELAIGEESDPHFNAIARTGSGALFIAGERGAAFRSRDQGKTWEHIKLPYEGSMFGALGYEGEHVLTFGLRGHVYETDDLGTQWKEVPTDSNLSLIGGVRLSNGGAALVGTNGLVLVRRSAEEALKAGSVQPASTLAAILPAEGGATFTVAGENGIGRYQPK